MPIRAIAGNATGFGLFFALNFAAMWLDVMPFVPSESQTPLAASEFFVSSMTLEVSFAFFTLLAHARPSAAERLVFPLSAIPYALGMILLAVISLSPAPPLPLWVFCGLLLGWGTGGTFIAWCYAFSLQRTELICPTIIFGTMGAAVLYIVLDFLGASPASTALVAFMSAIEIMLLRRGSRSPQRLAVNAPLSSESARKRHVRYVKDYWRTAACTGILGFCVGAVRTLAASLDGFSHLVNVAAMAILFCGLLAFYTLWNKRPLRISTTSAYRTVAPIGLALFAAMILGGGTYVVVCSGVLFAFFGCVTVLGYLQCLSASTKRELGAIFAFSFFFTIVWSIYDLGHIAAITLVSVFGTSSIATLDTALICACLLGFGLFIVQGGFRSITSPQEARIENLDLLRTAAMPLPRKRETATDAPSPVDRITAQVDMLAERHGLTAREAEIAQMVVRGFTVRAISEQLTISENTIRTHTKSLYRKLDIHKKADLASLVAAVELE